MPTDPSQPDDVVGGAEEPAGAPGRDLPAELEAVRRRADRQYWRFLAVYLPMYFVGTIALHLLRGRGETIGDVVSLAIVVVVLGVLAMLLFRRRRRWLPRQPLTAGLSREQNRAVRADLRRGQFSEDPLLAEVERLSVPRLRRAGRFTVWLLAAFCALSTIAAVLTRQGPWTTTLYVLAAVVLLAAAGYQVLLNRRLRAFPL